MRHLIQHKFWLKLFSLMLATLIWFAVQFGIQSGWHVMPNPITNPIQREKIVLPVFVITQAADARVFRVDPQTVSLTVEAEAAILRELSRRDFKAYIDLSIVRAEEKTTEKIRVHLPEGVVLLDLNPQTVLVQQVSP